MLYKFISTVYETDIKVKYSRLKRGVISCIVD